MNSLLHNRAFYVSIASLVIVGIGSMMYFVASKEPAQQVTATVETGDVRQLVSVSGIAEAEQSAELAFPVSGIVERVLVKKGDVVEAGDILVELDRQALLADRADAVARLAQAQANRDELIAGPTNTARNITDETLSLKEQSLQTTIASEERKVENALSDLLSSDLEAVTDDAQEDANAPVVSGTYTCEKEGVYTIDVYASKSDSGYSYRLSGIESGTFTASVEQPTAMGSCGLRLLFDDDSRYERTVWRIEIPNTKSASYIAKRNAYALAQTQAQNAIKLAEQDVALANANAENDNASPRSEAVTRTDASVAQARAQLNRVDATIADRVLRAPFSGTVTELSVLPGETVTTAPVLTLLAAADFEVTARIPEIDIGKLLVGQPVEMVFDARSGETLMGTIDFISLQATEIDGVAYYEAVIFLETVPEWLRSGLNADIDIIISEAKEQLRVPKRFVFATDDGYKVLKQTGETTATTTVRVELEGNDGFIALTGLNEGDVLVAP